MRGEDALLATLERVAAGLQQAEVPFALAGGYAVYARGGQESAHDVDFLVPEEQVERALDALARRGLTPERPPEDWLVKVYDGGCMVDLIFRPAGGQVPEDLLGRADELTVGSTRMPVLTATDLVLCKLDALSEDRCDLAAELTTARALLDQVDWPAVAKETRHSPYAYAFLVLLDRLGLVEGVTE